MAKNLVNSNNIEVVTSDDDLSLDFSTTVKQKIEQIEINKNDIANLKGKILWTNPNPTNNFGAQTIAIDFSNYDMYEVVFYQSTTHNERELTSGRIRTQKGSILSYVPNNIFRVWNCTNSNISFESISDNSNLIPAYIIGYKTGLFN